MRKVLLATGLGLIAMQTSALRADEALGQAGQGSEAMGHAAGR